MGLWPLCMEPHRVLRTPARRVEAFTDELRAFVRDLIETMDANDGIGLAAPQVGQGVQVFVANPSRQRGRELVVVNPVLDILGGCVRVTEGCLSLPSVWGRVKRAARVQVQGLDPFGRPVAVETDGLLAVVLQHECDHLQGRLFIDRLPWLQRRRLRAGVSRAAVQCG